MTMDTTTLRQHIEAVFGRMSYPGDDHIVADNSGRNVEYERIKRQLVSRHWRDVPSQTLIRLRDQLSYLSPEGYRFYLPAFMLYCIGHPSGNTVDSVVGTLTLPYPSD